MASALPEFSPASFPPLPSACGSAPAALGVNTDGRPSPPAFSGVNGLGSASCAIGPSAAPVPYAQMVAGSPMAGVFAKSSYKGEIAIVIPKAVESTMAFPFRFSIVGKFTHSRPSLDSIRKFLSVQNFSGDFSVGLLDNKHALIRFSLEIDYIRLFSKASWAIGNKVMRVFKWTPDFHVDKESSIIPLWLSFPKLPIHLMTKEFLFAVVSSFGKPLRLDAATVGLKNPSVARIQAEIDILKPPPTRVWIQREEVPSFWQLVCWDVPIPPFCTYCSHLGHSEVDCIIKHPNLAPPKTTHGDQPSIPIYRPKQPPIIIAEDGNQVQSVNAAPLDLPPASIADCLNSQSPTQASPKLASEVLVENKSQTLGDNLDRREEEEGVPKDVVTITTDIAHEQPSYAQTLISPIRDGTVLHSPAANKILSLVSNLQGMQFTSDSQAKSITPAKAVNPNPSLLSRHPSMADLIRDDSGVAYTYNLGSEPHTNLENSYDNLHRAWDALVSPNGSEDELDHDELDQHDADDYQGDDFTLLTRQDNKAKGFSVGIRTRSFYTGRKQCYKKWG